MELAYQLHYPTSIYSVERVDNINKFLCWSIINKMLYNHIYASRVRELAIFARSVFSVHFNLQFKKHEFSM